jgi:hypothetical protein
LLTATDKKKWAIKTREYWDFIQTLETLSPEPETVNLIQNIRHMEDLKSGLGRGRAWTRMALMEQTFSEHWAMLVNAKENVACVPSVYLFISGSITSHGHCCAAKKWLGYRGC